MKDTVAVASPEIGTPPIQDRIQLPNHLADRRATGKRSDSFAYPIPDMLARLLAWPHVQQPSRGFPKLKTKKREALFHRGQTTLLLVHHQSKWRKLALETLPRGRPHPFCVTKSCLNPTTSNDPTLYNRPFPESAFRFPSNVCVTTRP